jgi:uncharacterized membrane protein
LNLSQYKALFILVTAVLALLVASPALQRGLVYPQNRSYTELSLLGPGRTTSNYPYNITQGENYTVFLGITNQLGSCAYYQVEVKFRNETQSAPDTLNQTSSSLSPLYVLDTFVADKESLEIPVNFMFHYSINNSIEANFDNLTVNGETLKLRGLSSSWNQQVKEFYGNLIFELWIYNGPTVGFQYTQRYVDLKLNMTSIS